MCFLIKMFFYLFPENLLKNPQQNTLYFCINNVLKLLVFTKFRQIFAENTFFWTMMWEIFNSNLPACKRKNKIENEENFEYPAVYFYKQKTQHDSIVKAIFIAIEKIV